LGGIGLHEGLVREVLEGNSSIYGVLDMQPASPISPKDNGRRDKLVYIISQLIAAIPKELDKIDEWVIRANQNKKLALEHDLREFKEIFEQKKASLDVAESSEIKGIIDTANDLSRRSSIFHRYEKRYKNPSVDQAVTGMVIKNLTELTSTSSICRKKKTIYRNEKIRITELGKAYLKNENIVIVRQRYGGKFLDKVLVIGIIANAFPLTAIIDKEEGHAIPELVLEGVREYASKGDKKITTYRYIMKTPKGGRTILCRSEDDREELDIKEDRIYQAVINIIKGNKWYGHIINQSPSRDNPVFDVHQNIVEYNRKRLPKNAFS
jgi:hypothetical protein